MEEVIQHGRKGLDGLANFVKHFVVKQGVSMELFEGKLMYLMSKLEEKWVATLHSQEFIAHSINLGSLLLKVLQPPKLLCQSWWRQSFCWHTLPWSHSGYLKLTSLMARMKLLIWIPSSLKIHYVSQRNQEILYAKDTFSLFWMDSLSMTLIPLLYTTNLSYHGTTLYAIAKWPCSHGVALDWLKRVWIPAMCVRIYLQTRCWKEYSPVLNKGLTKIFHLHTMAFMDWLKCSTVKTIRSNSIDFES